MQKIFIFSPYQSNLIGDKMSLKNENQIKKKKYRNIIFIVVGLINIIGGFIIFIDSIKNKIVDEAFWFGLYGLIQGLIIFTIGLYLYKKTKII